MKKLLVLLMVLAFVAPVAPVMADDNLDVTGQVRIRSWDRENYSDFNDDGDDKEEYIEQRFRLQATIKANDQVKAVTRIDLAETKWGSSKWTGARPGIDGSLSDVNSDGNITQADDISTSPNDVIQVDRAYLDVTTGPVNIKAGQQFMAVGQSQVIRNNKPGFQITIKTPVIIELGYSVQGDDDQGGIEGNPGNTEDDQNTHLSVAYKADAFSVEGFYGMDKRSIDGTAGDEDIKTVFGVNFKTSIGPVKLNSELALFGGENESSNTDYVGTQLNIDADMKINDMVKIGADFIYSQGTDDANETKIAYIGDVFGRLNRSEGGSGNNIFAGDLAPIGGDDVFDPFNDDLGSIGIGVDAVITPVAGFDILAHVLYLTAQEDGSTGDYEDAIVYNLGLSYMLAPKAKLALYYNVVDADFEGGGSSDNASNLGGLLQISF